MKKIISIVLLLAMCLGLFAACGESEPAETTAASDLASAKEYLTSMYQTGKKGEPIVITADHDVLKSIAISGVTYTVDWKVAITSGDEGSVTVGESNKANHVKLDIPLHSGKDILFTATATITDPNGATDTVSFDYKVAGVQLAGEGMTMEELVEAAYALEQDAALEGLGVLTGTIITINTPYDDGYKNVTVTIQIGELSSKPIKCYRLKGDGADNLGIGDIITVSGTLKNYKGNIQFDAGCMIDELIKNPEPAPEGPTDPIEIVEAAYGLATDEALPYSSTLTGVITTINTPYDEGFGNLSVTITVAGCEDKPILCYRLKGDGAAQLAVGDTITVTGNLMNYKDTVEFGQGCTLDAVVAGNGDVQGGEEVTEPTEGNTENNTDVVAPTNPTDIVDAAYALEKDTALPYTATLTGTVFSVDDAYNADYKNVTVTIQVKGRESKPIKCYRMKGNGADQVAKGDTITVTGTLKNYNGTVEFDVGCEMTNRVAGGNKPVVQETDPSKIMDAAAKLKENEEMSYDVTLSGKITVVNDAYDPSFKNITVTMAVSGTRSFLKVYRLKGDGTEKLAKGDDITVTGRIKNYYGELEMINCTLTKYTSNGGTVEKVESDPAKIVDAAYNLAENTEMSYDVELTGKVTTINTAYDASFGNVSVTIAVSGRESKPIECYRMKGDGVDKICAGDTITVKGRIKNYNGTVEFDAGCQMTNRKSSGVEKPSDPKKIVDAAFALDKGASLPYTATLTGKITEIATEYSDQYKNITVIIEVDSSNGKKSIECYRMKGDGAESLKVGDTINVTGILTRYYKDATEDKPVLDKIEFGANCTFTK